MNILEFLLQLGFWQWIGFLMLTAMALTVVVIVLGGVYSFPLAVMSTFKNKKPQQEKKDPLNDIYGCEYCKEGVCEFHDTMKKRRNKARSGPVIQHRPAPDIQTR